MTDRILIRATGDAIVDQTLQELIALYERVFPGRVWGYFLEGSQADQTALATSDVDLIFVFKDSFADDIEKEWAETIGDQFNATVQPEIDIGFVEESQIACAVPPSLKLGSTLLYGEPIPDGWPLVSVAEWGRERMHASYWLMTKVFGRPDFVSLPRDYPKPEADFYGYTERTVRLPEGSEVASTRDLIRVMGWAGTALVARLGGQIVARKQECHLLYRQTVGDGWSSFFESLYTQCREEWNYRIPTAPDARAELTQICQQALAFENHFLGIYRGFLLAELREADEPEKLHALWVQQRIPFRDPEVIGAVRLLSTSADEPLKQAALALLPGFEKPK